MTKTSALWGELRSLCQVETIQAIEAIARLLDLFDVSVLPQALSYAVDHVSGWSEDARFEARLPYTRWFFHLLDQALDDEFAGRVEAMVAVVGQLQSFYPESVVLSALMERHRIRAHVATQSWQTVPQLSQATRDVFAQLAGELPTTPDMKPGFGVLKHMFEQVQLNSEYEGWEYLVAIVARCDAHLGIAGLMVLWQQTQDHELQKATATYLQHVISKPSYMGKYNRGYSFTERRPHVFMDLHRLARMPSPRGYAAASSSGEGSVQRVLSGRLFFQAALSQSPEHTALKHLVEMSRGPDEPVSWEIGDEVFWPPAELYDDPQAVVDRLDAMSSHKRRAGVYYQHYDYDALVDRGDLWF